MALDVGPRNSGAAVPAVQPDVKSKRGNSHQRRRQGRRERRRPKIVATENLFLYTARFAWGLVQMRVTRVLRCQPPSQIEDRSEAPRISGSAGEATRHKIVATEKIVNFFAIRTVLGIGTGNSSAVVSVAPSDRSSKRGALLGPKRHPKCQDRTSTWKIGIVMYPTIFTSAACRRAGESGAGVG